MTIVLMYNLCLGTKDGGGGEQKKQGERRREHTVKVRSMREKRRRALWKEKEESIWEGEKEHLGRRKRALEKEEMRVQRMQGVRSRERMR